MSKLKEPRTKKRLTQAEITELKGYFEQAKLAAPRHVAKNWVTKRSLDAPAHSVYVDDGSIVCFVEGVDPGFQSDILNSTLYAQLWANHEHDREADAQGWYRRYIDVLEHAGWTLQGFQLVKFNASGGSFTCDKAIIEVLSAIATGGQTAILGAALNAMKGLSRSDGRLVLFERESHHLHQANFQVGLAVQTGGVVSMRTACFEMNCQQDITSVLWFSWESASSDLYHSTQNMTLNNDVYSYVRNIIINKLGTSAQQYILQGPSF